MNVDVEKIREWFISTPIVVYDGATPIHIRPDKVALILGPTVEYVCKRSRPELTRTYIGVEFVDRNIFSDCEEVATVDVRFKSGHRHVFKYKNKFNIGDVMHYGVARHKADVEFIELRVAVEACRERSLWSKIARYVSFAIAVAVATVGTGLIIIIKGKK